MLLNTSGSVFFTGQSHYLCSEKELHFWWGVNVFTYNSGLIFMWEEVCLIIVWTPEYSISYMLKKCSFFFLSRTAPKILVLHRIMFIHPLEICRPTFWESLNMLDCMVKAALKIKRFSWIVWVSPISLPISLNRDEGGRRIRFRERAPWER